MRFLNRLSKSIVIVLTGAALLVAPVMAAYSANVSVVESGVASYNQIPIKLSANVDNWVSGYYISSDGLDVQLLKSGSSIPLMLTDDALYFSDSVAQGGTANYSLTTGNTPAASMPIVLGYNGYITTGDNAALELGDDYEIEVSGYFNGTIGTKTESETFEQTGSPDVSLVQVAGAYWASGIFSFTNTVNVSEFMINVSKTGSPGTLTWGVYATSASKPTGAALRTGTIDAGDVGAGYTEIDCVLSTSISFTGGTEYAVVLSAASGSLPSNYYAWARTGTTGKYATSTNSGASWTAGSVSVHITMTGTYQAPTDPTIVSKASSLLFNYTNDNEVTYAVTGGNSLVATGVTTGEHIIKIVSNGVTMKLYVDAVEKDSDGASSVPDTANDYEWLLDNVAPYVDYIKVKVGGSLVLHYQPATIVSGTTLPDLESTEDGVITFGSNPAGVTTSLASFRADGVTAGAESTPGTPGIGTGSDPISNTTTDTTGTFLDPLIAVFVTASNGSLTTELAWWGLFLISLLVAFVFGYAKFQHLFIGAGLMVIVSIIFCVGFNTIPDVVMALVILLMIGAVLMESRQTV